MKTMMQDKLAHMEGKYKTANERVMVLTELLTAAYYALRSYQYGNASEELAETTADALEIQLGDVFLGTNHGK